MFVFLTQLRYHLYYAGWLQDQSGQCREEKCLVQGAVREMTCFDMDCTRPVGEVEGWVWWSWALYEMPFSCHHAFLVA